MYKYIGFLKHMKINYGKLLIPFTAKKRAAQIRQLFTKKELSDYFTSHVVPLRNRSSIHLNLDFDLTSSTCAFTALSYV